MSSVLPLSPLPLSSSSSSSPSSSSSSSTSTSPRPLQPPTTTKQAAARQADDEAAAVSLTLADEILASSAIQFDFNATRSRYFILKPVGKGTIRKAIRSNTYSLQANVASRLNASLATASAVVLICSALNSHSFQAAARVARPIDIQMGKKRALVEVEWLTGFTFVAFAEVEHLKNPFKGNVRVTESQDGQEIYYEQGMAITQLLAFRSDSSRSQAALASAVQFHDDDNNNSKPATAHPDPVPDWLRSQTEASLLGIYPSLLAPAFADFLPVVVEPALPPPPPAVADVPAFASLFGGADGLGELLRRGAAVDDAGRFNCALCGREGLLEKIQYFPCRDVLCRGCSTKLNASLQSPGAQSCPLCRSRDESQLGAFLFDEEPDFDFKRIDTSFLESK